MAMSMTLLAFFVLGVGVHGCKLYKKGPIISNNTMTCGPHTCGERAYCVHGNEKLTCACLPNFSGDPLTECVRIECVDDSECLSHQACLNQQCVNLCDPSPCGANTKCVVRNHVGGCSCLDGYTGNPLLSCQKADPVEACQSSPCGPNSQCRLIRNETVCACLPGYRDIPPRCRPECESNSDCETRLSCQDSVCKSPCSDCGVNADCEFVAPHNATCKCHSGYLGNPYENCIPECSSYRECPKAKPACVFHKCINPCTDINDTCGVNAKCDIIGHWPVCSCPMKMTGDPFYFCRPIEARDACESNPCGHNAVCKSVSGHGGAEVPTCFCPAGYLGDPFFTCDKGECELDSQCPDHLACVGYQCVDPCLKTQCGSGAVCMAQRHLAVCTCLKGRIGDALVNCYQSWHVRFIRYKRNANFTKPETETF